MAADGVRLLPETIRSRDSATFTGSYQTLGSVLSNPIRILKIVNNSNVDVTLSWDGTNDHDFIPASSAFILDVATNRQSLNYGTGQLYIGQATQFYIKGSAGGGNSGLVYLVAFYA